MSLVTALRSGSLGATFELPNDVALVRDDDHTAVFVDRENGVTWWAFFVEGLYLDLSPRHEAPLRRDVENHARYLFESAFASPDIPDRSPNVEPRTADATWSPVTDLELGTMGDARALFVIHRMHYEPGLETVMGHALLPLRAGLLELRAVAGTRQTGLRETTLSMSAHLRAERRPAEELASDALRFDDPAFDGMFPDHPLSRVRAALRRCRTRTTRVDAPASMRPTGKLRSPRTAAPSLLRLASFARGRREAVPLLSSTGCRFRAPTVSTRSLSNARPTPPATATTTRSRGSRSRHPAACFVRPTCMTSRAPRTRSNHKADVELPASSWKAAVISGRFGARWDGSSTTARRCGTSTSGARAPNPATCSSATYGRRSRHGARLALRTHRRGASVGVVRPARSLPKRNGRGRVMPKTGPPQGLPFTMRNTLLRSADAGLFQVYWSNQIRE